MILKNDVLFFSLYDKITFLFFLAFIYCVIYFFCQNINSNIFLYSSFLLCVIFSFVFSSFLKKKLNFHQEYGILSPSDLNTKSQNIYFIIMNFILLFFLILLLSPIKFSVFYYTISGYIIGLTSHFFVKPGFYAYYKTEKDIIFKRKKYTSVILYCISLIFTFFVYFYADKYLYLPLISSQIILFGLLFFNFDYDINNFMRICGYKTLYIVHHNTKKLSLSLLYSVIISFIFKEPIVILCALFLSFCFLYVSVLKILLSLICHKKQMNIIFTSVVLSSFLILNFMPVLLPVFMVFCMYKCIKSASLRTWITE